MKTGKPLENNSVAVLFTVLHKDHKDVWDNHQERIHEIEAAGFPVKTEVTGDKVGLDSDFLVLTSEPVLEGFAVLLVKLAYLELYWWDERERADTELEVRGFESEIEHISKVEVYQKEEFEITRIYLRSEEVVEFVDVPAKKNTK